MLVKFFANKQGGSISGINYLLNDRVKQGTARVLKGSQDATRQIVLNITKKQKLCMGCLSFEEKDIDLKTKQTIIDEFETIMFGKYKDRYNILWVEHTDKQRLELNFAIPKIDLINALAFNPYYDKVDRGLVDSWQNYINLRLNLSDPKDPAKSHILQDSKKELNMAKDYIELEKILVDKFINNEFDCRNEILKSLKDSGIEVTRVAKDHISVKLPNSKKAKRFKGGMFNESFTDITSLEQLRENRQRRAKEFIDRADEKRNIFERRTNQHLTRQSFIFANGFSSSKQRELRIIKFKQQLSRKDKELNRLKQIFDNKMQKRNIWLKQQASREPKRNINISNTINSNVYSDNFSIDMDLRHLFKEQETSAAKSKYENLYTTKYNWQRIESKNKIFIKRTNDDIIRARIIRRIRDKRESRAEENEFIKRTICRVKELRENTILIDRQSEYISREISEFRQCIYGLKTNTQRTNSNTTRISKLIRIFRDKIDIFRKYSNEFISRAYVFKREIINSLKLEQESPKTISKKRDVSDLGMSM